MAENPENTPTPSSEPVGKIAAIDITPTPTPTPTPILSPTPTATPAPEPEPIPTPTPLLESTPLTILSIIGGEVLVMSAGTDGWHPATIGTTLHSGDIIKTGNNSKAEITFFDGSTIELEASTEIAVAELGISDTGTTTVRLAQHLGKTISRIKKLTDTASRYEIETPAAIAAVRGSTMLVTVYYNGKTVVGNEHGDIIILVDGKEYIIHEGMKRTIEPDELPGPEVPINPAPAGGGGGGGGYTPVLQARMDITMHAEPPEAHTGDNITYSYYLVNTGDLPFHNITVSNNIAGNAIYQSGDTNFNAILDSNETWVLSSVYTVREGDPSLLVATATISATTSTSVMIVDTETATVFISNPGITMVKIADPVIAHEGDNITYTYEVINTGDTPLMGIAVSDDLIESIIFISSDNNTDEILDIGEIWLFSANYTVSDEDPDFLVNTANVSGMDSLEETARASDNASVTILRPGIVIVKTADVSEVHLGDIITYTCNVTNTGNTPLADVVVTDDQLGIVPYISGDTDGDSILETGETWVFSATYTVSDEDLSPLTNIAYASGMDALLQIVTDADTVSITILPCS